AWRATPIQVAPPSIAARAAVSMPCPYPSAFTTAISAVCSSTSVPIARVFSVIAEGSIMARLGTCRGSSAGIGMVIELLGSRQGARQVSRDHLGQVRGHSERDQRPQTLVGCEPARPAVEPVGQGSGR